MTDNTSKGLTTLGLLLLTIPAVAIVIGSIYGLSFVLFDPNVPMWIKALLVIGLIGGVILLVVVIRDRLREAKDDPYKDIEI